MVRQQSNFDVARERLVTTLVECEGFTREAAEQFADDMHTVALGEEGWLAACIRLFEATEPKGTQVTEYDSTPDTIEHINTVVEYIEKVRVDLYRRATQHDRTKLEEPEKSVFDRATPHLSKTEYGSAEYEGHKKSMGKALQHHYEHNDHHPEHFENGIHGMGLVQLIEMLADWKAAGERHKDGGDLRRSIELNQERFGYSDELKGILLNTIEVFE